MQANQLLKGVLAAIVLQSMSPQVSATDYTAGLKMKVDASHNDNIRLTQRDKTAVKKYDAAPTITFSANTETTTVRLDSLFDFNHYDKSEFNSNDQNIALALSHQYESSSLALDAGYIHNSTLSSEQLTSGRIGTKADRAEQYNLSPSWKYTLDERNLLQLSGTYTTQNYESTEYIGYKNKSAELDWFHRINERLKIIGSASYSEYRSDDRSFDVYQIIPPLSITIFGSQSYSTRTQTESFQLGAEYQITEGSSLTGRFGRSRNDTTKPIKDPDNACAYGGPILGAVCEPLPHAVNFGVTAQLGWDWHNERQQFSLTSTKQTQPTSNGYTVDALQAGASWSYQLSELDKISATLSAVRNRAIDKTTTQQGVSYADRNYASATLQYQRYLTENWALTAGFQFSGQKYPDIDYRASARAYSLGINYRPQQWHWAR